MDPFLPLMQGEQAEPMGDVPALQPQLCSAMDALRGKVGAERVKPDFCKQHWLLKTPASLRMSQLLVI